MILKYYTIVIKDIEGFVVPYLINGVPLLFPSKEIADDELFHIRRSMEHKLNPHVENNKGLGKLFKHKPVKTVYTEEQKKNMRWFISTSSVREATVNL